MNSTIERALREKAAELAELCRRHGVARLDIFGSATSDEFDFASSDLDFLVEFDAIGRTRAFDNYFGLKEDLTALLTRPVDLLTARSLRNPVLIREIQATRQTVYASPP